MKIGILITAIFFTLNSPLASALSLVGESCSQDSDCSSTCCTAQGRCGAHDPLLGQYCNKPVGESCLDSSYCEKVVVISYDKIIIGLNELGQRVCGLRTSAKLQHADCDSVENICTHPKDQNNYIFISPLDCSDAKLTSR